MKTHQSDTACFRQIWEVALGAALHPLTPPPETSEFYRALAGGVDRLVNVLAEDATGRAAGLSVLGGILEEQPTLPRVTDRIGALCQTPLWESERERLTAALLLRASLRRRVNGHPDIIGPEVWDTVEPHLGALSSLPLLSVWNSRDLVRTAVRAAAADRNRSFRVLFPTVPAEGSGQLVWAEITVCERLDAVPGQAGPRLILAPWTFYLPGFETISRANVPYHDLCAALPGALATLGCRTPADFLLSLQPLRPEDVLWRDGWADRLGAITALTPRPYAKAPEGGSGLTINGPSLGLAVALAAYAAFSGRRIRPLVATGRIDAEGRVGVVNAVPRKMQAWIDFRRPGAESPAFLCPNDIDYDERAGLCQNCAIHISQLPQLEGYRTLFTDGFDGYRQWLGCHRPPTEPLPENRGDAGRTLAALRELCLSGNSTPSAGQAVESISHFDDDPRDLADAVFGSLAEVFLNTVAESSFDAPVVLHVLVKDLLGPSGWTEPSLFDQRLADALRLNCPDWTCDLPRPDAEDFATARLRPGKLILIVSDVRSAELWPDVGAKGRAELAKALRELASLQHVVMVFSDWHHRQWFHCP